MESISEELTHTYNTSIHAPRKHISTANQHHMDGRSKKNTLTYFSSTQTPNPKLKLRIMGPTKPITAGCFQLPEGWEVEERPRRTNSLLLDKYYYEPGTGQQFRSLSSVQEYLAEETNAMLTTNGPELGKKKKVRPKVKMQYVPSIIDTSLLPDIPDDWVVEKVPRSNVNYAHVIDTYYIEPSTGMRFRSRMSAQKYIAERERLIAPFKASTQGKHSNREFEGRFHSTKIVLKHSAEQEGGRATRRAPKRGNHSTPSTSTGLGKQISFKENRSSPLDSLDLPAKVKWVLNGPGGNVWTPFMDDAMVSESVKQKWSEAFVSTLNNRL